MIPDYAIQSLEQDLKRYELTLHIARLYQPLLSDSVTFNPAVYITINVYNRPDLQLLMQLAPVWKKTPFPEGIYYKAMVEGEEITLIAYSGALPKTCKFVEEEVILPAEAAKPERRVLKKVLKCDLSHE